MFVIELEADVERRARVRCGCEIDRSAHELDDGFRNRQAETGTLHAKRRVIRLLTERDEDLVLSLFGNAYTVVLDGKD